MPKKIYSVEEVVQMVNCCYFVGSCKTCPCWKPTGFAGIGKCIGQTEVGNILLSILEPIMEKERVEKKQPSLFDEVPEAPDMDAAEADPVAAETIEEPGGDPDADPEAVPEVLPADPEDPEAEADAICGDFAEKTEEEEAY